MVNNAAIIADTSALHVTEAEIDRIHSVNFKGAVFGSQAAASAMVPRQKGSIVTILSAAIDLPAPTVPAYATAKAASAQFSRSLAMEVAASNVRVNAVAPGWTDTPMNHRHSVADSGEIDDAQRDAYRDKWAETIPLRTAGTPEDQAFAVLYLASPASRFVTGTVIRPNGGMVMPW
jgi:3-oxoacyl-[acyl-carrier protein] reductase